MNILYLANHLNTGGITSYILSLSAGLKARGHNVYIASSGGELVSKFIEQGITYVHIPIKTKSEVSPKILISLFRLLPHIKEKKIDIIHANTRVTQVLGCLIGKVSGKPFISTCHGFFKKRFSRRVLPCWGRKAIAISAQVRQHLIDDFNLKEDAIRVIHNGIDASAFLAQTAQDRLQKKNNLRLGSGPLVGIIARLSDVKGHIYLLEAMKMVLESVPEAQLLIVGDGKMKNELVLLSKRLGIEKKAFFMPSLIDTREVLSIMDLFVMPSIEEGLGLSLMEAMAQGIAVIGSAVGGIKELIQNDYNGLLVEPKNTNELSIAMLELLKDPERRGMLGRNARSFIARNFSLEQMISRTERVYRECLSIKN